MTSLYKKRKPHGSPILISRKMSSDHKIITVTSKAPFELKAGDRIIGGSASHSVFSYGTDILTRIVNPLIMITGEKNPDHPIYIGMIGVSPDLPETCITPQSTVYIACSGHLNIPAALVIEKTDTYTISISLDNTNHTVILYIEQTL